MALHQPHLHSPDTQWRPMLIHRDLAPFWLAGVHVNGALYNIGCFAAGLATHNVYGWWPAILSAGAAYVSYSCYAIGQPHRLYPVNEPWMGLGHTFAAASIGFSLLAGVALLF